MFCQHSTASHLEVQVLGKNHPCNVTKLVSGQKVKLTTNVVDMLMERTNLGLPFPVISRTFFLISQFALQPSELALQIHEKARAFYQFSSRYSQELFKSQINANGFTVRHGFRHGNICLQNQLGIPARRFKHNPNLLDFKPVWDGSMQVD